MQLLQSVEHHYVLPDAMAMKANTKDDHGRFQPNRSAEVDAGRHALRAATALQVAGLGKRVPLPSGELTILDGRRLRDRAAATPWRSSAPRVRARARCCR